MQSASSSESWTQVFEQLSMPPHDLAKPPAKKQPKWSREEDTHIIELRGKGMKWEDISQRLPGRSAISCRLHYQNYLERRSEWDEERKNKLARLYERFKQEMWAKIAEEMAVPWRAAEAMHWQLGEADMARRAGVIPFSLAAVNVDGNKNDQSSSSRRVSPQFQDGTLHNPGAPSARTMFSSLPLSTQSGLPQASSPLYGDHRPSQYQYVPESGLAPSDNQPPPRTAGMLPRIAGLDNGIGLCSTNTEAPYLGSSTSTDRGLGDSSLARYSIASPGSKRGTSTYQPTANKRQRIA